mgnify:CR=1 FL=1
MKNFVMAALGGTVAGALITTQVAGPLLAQESVRTTSVYEQLDLFGDIFERIRAQYVEEVDEADLIEAAINGMLTSLDPHSSYLSPKDAAKMLKAGNYLWNAGIFVWSVKSIFQNEG